MCTALLSAISLPLPRSTFTRFLTFHYPLKVCSCYCYSRTMLFIRILIRRQSHIGLPCTPPPHPTHHYRVHRCTALINIYLYGFRCAFHSSQGMVKITLNIYCIILLYKQIVVAMKYSRWNRHCFCFVVFSAPFKNFPQRSQILNIGWKSHRYKNALNLVMWDAWYLIILSCTTNGNVKTWINIIVMNLCWNTHMSIVPIDVYWCQYVAMFTILYFWILSKLL